MKISPPAAAGQPGPAAARGRAGSAARRGRALAVAAGLLGAAGLAPVALPGTAHAQGTCTVSGPTTTCTFAFTGAEQTFTVPNGVTQVDVTAIGAAGGLEGGNDTPGGRGAQVSGTLTGLSGGQTLYVEVGGNATNDGSCFPTSHCTGGFNGGGSTHFGGGGGGASDIRTQPRTTPLTTTDSRLIVAAGGGGAGLVYTIGCPAGPGGDAGQPGTDGGCNGGTGGGAGTATQGGAGGQQFGSPGTLGTGGTGGGPGASLTGGAGGAGYYGGGGGGNINLSVNPTGNAGGGGGGSSLVPAGGTGPTVTSAAASITISYLTPGKPVNTRLIAIPRQVRLGRPVVLDDLVCPAGTGATTRPTGTVTFTDTTTGTTLGTARLVLNVGNCAAAGRVVFLRTPGPHVITAVYSGDSVYQGNSGNPETLTVTVNP
ncbi:glycine-rich protein [Kitasatospora aureofaciens]|uniref:glycine-rich protein n=1 Tax=Kitasatospora aureofaciens TaxID=1894 RepID=UPI00068C9D37|nr:glycine-rich protein [Kitasatospora aureofaciens]HJD84292.1 Ig-like domain repeat protein [Kitasatospora aureofaciens]